MDYETTSHSYLELAALVDPADQFEEHFDGEKLEIPLIVLEVSSMRIKNQTLD